MSVGSNLHHGLVYLTQGVEAMPVDTNTLMIFQLNYTVQRKLYYR